MSFSTQFTHAITRRPAASITRGLRAVDTGTPDLAQMQAHHAAYVATLRETGATVVELPPLDAYPDSVFVEDTALCLPQGAVVMRPGAPSRLGEAAEMTPHLQALYARVVAITGADSFIEGGDILVTEREILVGRSARTNAAGIAELTALVAPWGHKVREVHTPPGVLHFKTDCSLLDVDTILATRRLSVSGCFAGYRVIDVPEGEEAAANTIRFNDLVQGPQSLELASDAGDYVVLRADGLFAYQLAVIVDDIAAGVTHVVRGADLLDSTARQIHLQGLLGAPPPTYAHLPLATNAAGEKLSKQTLARAIDDAPPAAALLAALRFLGQAPPPTLASAPLAQIWAWALAHWSIDAVPRCRKAVATAFF